MYFNCLKFMLAVSENLSVSLNCRFFDWCLVGTLHLKRSFFTLLRKIFDLGQKIFCCRKIGEYKSWGM